MKLHLSMRVPDIDGAIEFYSALFGQQPSVRRDAYAKWDVDDPAVNFVVQVGDRADGLDHLGIQVQSPEDLAIMADRMRSMGRPFLDVEETTCCYARMDKAWVKGEAGEAWEAFLTHGHDEEDYGTDRVHLLDGAGAEPCCGPGSKREACC